jgi:arylsulfatase A-like enzyme
MPGSSALNVLFVTVDQWRGDCLSHLGHPVVQTPSLDRLAAEGVSFARHYAQAAPCGPSRASLYTGCYLMNHRSVGNGTPLDERFTNVALEARAAGYDPELFGYTDTSVDPRTVDADDPRLFTYEGILPGFTPTCHLPEGEPDEWLTWLRAEGVSVPDEWRRLDDEVPGRPGLAAGYDFEHTQTAFLTRRALERIAEHGERPWFVHVSYLRPHPPFVATAPYDTLYSPDDMPAPVRAETLEQEGEQHALAAVLVRHPLAAAPDPETLPQVRATYHGMQTEVDAWLGRLFDGVRELGVWDRTLVVVTSDHGEQLGDHWCAGKIAWFDESFHVPLVVRDPRAEADGTRGTVVRRFTEHVDVTPTILELVDTRVPAQCDGRSLVPFLHGAEPEGWRDDVHFEFDFRDPQNTGIERAFGIEIEEASLAVLRDDRGKYVQFGSATLPPIYFDLSDDPDMLVNRAADPALASTVLGYAQRMLAWRMRHADRSLANAKVCPLGLVERHGPRH